MQTINKTITFFALVAILLGGCQDAAIPHEQENPANLQADHSEEGDQLTLEQRTAIGLKVGDFSLLNMDETIKATGTLGLPPNSFSSVSPKAEGFIRDSKIYVEGNYIKKGALLAYLEHPSFIAKQQEYLEIKARLSFLNKDLIRQKALVAANAGIAKKIEQLESDIAIQSAKKAGLAKHLEYLGFNVNKLSIDNIRQRIAITSPISGYITHIDMHNGMYVRPEQALLEVIDDHHLHLELQVFEKDIVLLKEDQKIEYTIPAFGNKLYEGEVHIIGKEFDKAAKTLVVHGHLVGEQPTFIKDLYVEANIWTGNHEIQALPKEAISVDGVDSYIFFTLSSDEKAPWHFERVQVIPTKESRGYVGVKLLSPIPDDAKIVLKGAYYVGTVIKPGEAHEH